MLKKLREMKLGAHIDRAHSITVGRLGEKYYLMIVIDGIDFEWPQTCQVRTHPKDLLHEFLKMKLKISTIRFDGASESQVNAGARARLSSEDGVPQQQEAAPLSLPQLNRLFEASFARDESSASTAGAAIPSQFKVTQQILLHWQPFRDLKLNL